jgi:hypothetical protein
MDWSVFFSAFLGSSVVVALVGGLVSLRTSERQIAIENVTKERTKWREKIRGLALEIHRAATSKNTDKLNELHLEFALALNPKDGEDEKILECIRLIPGETTDDVLKEFTKRVSLLLKHDWERAKWEAKPVWWRCCRAPRRKDYKYRTSS